MSTEKELRELIVKHNKLVAEYKRYQEYIEVIPNVKLVKMIIFCFNWLGFGDNIQISFSKWVLCFDDALDGLDKESLKKVGDLLKAWVEAEIENAAQNQNLDAATLAELKQFRDNLTTRISEIDTVQDPNKHLASIKAFAQTSLSLAFTYLFRGLMNETVRKELRERIDLDPTSLLLKKFIILFFLKKILIRIFGEVLGKSIFGWITIVENIIEFIIFSGLRGAISAVGELIDIYRYILLTKILDCGGFPVWPMISRGVFISGDQWLGSRMFITIWCHCAKVEVEDGHIEKVEWSDPTQIPFEGGDLIQGKVLGKLADEDKVEKKFPTANGGTETRLVSQWDCAFTPDGDAIQNCLKGHKDCTLCEIYAEVRIVKTTGITTFHIPLSIHSCH